MTFNATDTTIAKPPKIVKVEKVIGNFIITTNCKTYFDKAYFFVASLENEIRVFTFWKADM